jgi:hypothetical protein
MPAWRGWLPLVALPAAVLLLWPRELPAWSRMWALAAALFAGCKWLTWRRTPAPVIPAWRHAAYLLAWPGLDAPAFLAAPREPARTRCGRGEWARGVLWLLAGCGLFWGASRVVPRGRELLAGLAGMAAVVLVLHFGSFRLLSCAWRAAGVQARPLMEGPLRAVSVSEFWGRRWNTAFRDLTHRFLFRPLARRLGPRGGIAAGFVFSGLVHDLVISVPAGGGYGLPTLYFALQGAALLAERSPAAAALGLGRGWRGWLFTLLVVGLPAPFLLFHPPFVRNVILPFMRALGAA